MKWLLIPVMVLLMTGCTLIGRVDVYEYVRTGGDLTELEIDETVWERVEEIDVWWDDVSE
jgi:hypothetical protein